MKKSSIQAAVRRRSGGRKRAAELRPAHPRREQTWLNITAGANAPGGFSPFA
jgi:hypothetical protein